MPQTALENGAGQLMSALLGGGRIEQNAQMAQQEAYDKADSLRAGLDKAITEAYLTRDKRNAQQGMEPAYIANGVDPITAHLLANANIGGFANLEQAQKYDMTHRAEKAYAADPNITAGNAITAAIAGKPISDVRIEDGNTVTHQYGAAPVVAPTQEGQAKIAADNALATQRNAEAGLANTRSAAGGFANGNPQAAVHGAAAKPEPYTEPAQAILKAAFTTTDKDGNPVYQPGDAQKFSQWRAAHPDFRNGAQALDTYQSLIDPLGHRYTNLNPVAHAVTNYDGTTPIVTPSGADPNITGTIYSIAKDAQASGHPLPLGSLRAAAELLAHGRGVGFAGNTAYETDGDGKPTSAALALHPELRKPNTMRLIDPNGSEDIPLPGAQHAQAAQAIVQAATGGVKPQADLPRPRSAAEAAALPRGARYVAPDGTVRTKS